MGLALAVAACSGSEADEGATRGIPSGSQIGSPDRRTGLPGVEDSAWHDKRGTAHAAGMSSAQAVPTAKSTPKLPPFTIAVLPDTQFYAESYPEVFEAQTTWIAKHHAEQGIKLVLHEGDIVNFDEPVQWTRAKESMGRLDGVVPYALARGNHDLFQGYSRVGGLMDSFFRASDFLRHSWFRETFESERMDDSFLLVDLNGQRWVVLALEYGPRDAVLDWAGAILDRHKDLPAILVTHAYLYDDQHRYDAKKHPEQLFNPHELPLEGGVNDGEEMWDKLVSKHDNLLFVLSGHVVENQTGLLTSRRANGTPCHQILANYQFDERGGNGFMRLMRVEPENEQVRVRTYSPFIDAYRTDEKNEFTIDLRR